MGERPVDENQYPDETMDYSDQAQQNGGSSNQEERIEKGIGVYPTLTTHRFMIHTEVHYIRITLH